MRIHRLPLLGAAALVVSAALAATALASPAARARSGSRASHAGLGSVGTRAAAAKSSFLAGYVWTAHSDNDAAGVTTSFVVPQVKHCTLTNTAIVPGAFVADLHTGTNSEAGLFVGCSGGKARYFPAFVVNDSVSQFKSLRAKPGDVIVVTVTKNESVTRVSLKDKTRPTVSKALTGAGTGASYATGDDAIGDFAWPVSGPPEPVPNFGKISFSGSEIDGLPLGTYGSQLTQFDLYDSTLTTLEVSTGSIASNGQSFKTTFVAP